MDPVALLSEIVGQELADRCASLAARRNISVAAVLRKAIAGLDEAPTAEAADMRRLPLARFLEVVLRPKNDQLKECVVHGDELIYGVDLGVAEAACFPEGSDVFVESDGPPRVVSHYRSSALLRCVRCGGSSIKPQENIKIVSFDTLPMSSELFAWIEIEDGRLGVAHPHCNGNYKEEP
jgi:hypothetical protein